MKKSFLNDLADDRIPLNSSKFAKSIPHGMKGVDLLEMLWTKKIKFERAVWLIQIIGAHDIVSGTLAQNDTLLKVRPCLAAKPSQRLRSAEESFLTSATILDVFHRSSRLLHEQADSRTWCYPRETNC